MISRLKNWLPLVAIVIALVAFGVALTALPGQQPAPTLFSQGITNFSGLDVTGSESGDLVVFDQKGTGDIVELRDDGSVVWRVADGGAQTFVGAADFDSTFNADGAGTFGSTLDVTGATEITGITTLNSNVTLNGARDGTTGYDYFMYVNGNNDGISTSAKTYGLYIELEREAGDNTLVGDLDDAGMKIRVTNAMTNPTTGNTLRGFDVNAKNDNPDGAITNLIGGLISIQTDTGAGNVSTGKALEVNVTGNAAITDTLMVGDFRLFRQSATEPTTEYIMRLRNSSTSGTGCDAGLYIERDGSGGTDDIDYGLDMSAADINTADIRLSNGETIANTTDGEVTFASADVEIGLFTIHTEQTAITVTNGGVLTPTGTYQPITAAGEVTPTVTTTGIDTGAILVIVNESAETINIADSGTMMLNAAVALGQYDTLTLLFDGTNWLQIATADN